MLPDMEAQSQPGAGRRRQDGRRKLRCGVPFRASMLVGNHSAHFSLSLSYATEIDTIRICTHKLGPVFGTAIMLSCANLYYTAMLPMT